MTIDEKRREIAGNLRYCAKMCHSVGVLDSDGGTIEILED